MRGKPGTKKTLHLFLLHMYIYCCHIARYDFANAILYFAHFQYS